MHTNKETTLREAIYDYITFNMKLHKDKIIGIKSGLDLANIAIKEVAMLIYNKEVVE